MAVQYKPPLKLLVWWLLLTLKTNIIIYPYPSFCYASLSKIVPWHDDVIKWKHFPRHWPFVRGIHRSPVNTLHKGQWRGALMFCLICAWTDSWANNGDAGDLVRYRAHYDVIVMFSFIVLQSYYHRRAYMATQLPLPQTIVDFWRLVYEYNCSCVITLEQPEHDDVVRTRKESVKTTSI